MAAAFVTPTNSPARSRISLGPGPVRSSPATPRQLLLLQEGAGSDEWENNDEAEKQERQKLRRLEFQQQSPSVPGDRRRSLLSGLAGLNGNQVAEHYTNCIKLSSENKITAKNAFSLHLIDCMEAMLKKKDSEMNNFQVASCTLDASAKIYAYRVDCVHADTYKIVGGILRTADKKDKKGNLVEVDDQAGSPNDDEEVVVKKKRSRKKSTIEQNIKNINLSKFELEFMIDPLFQKMRADFDEGGTGGLLLNNLYSRDDSSELLFDSTCRAFSEPEDKPPPTSKIDFSSVRNVLRKVTGDKVICPHFQDFSFLHWVPEANTDPNGKDNFAFNPDSVPEPILDPTEDYDDSHDQVADDFFGDDVAGSMCEERAACTAKPKTVRLEVSDLISVLADEPSDYSYFNVSYMSSWAGPDHWRTKPISKDKPAVVDTRRKRIPKPPFHVSFDDEERVELQFVEIVSGTTLSAATKNLWKEEKITLPVDLHYDLKKLLQPFCKPKLKVSKQKSAKSDIDDAVGHYDYDNENDCGEYCPGTVPNDGPSGEGYEASRYFVNEDSNDLFSQTCFDTNATMFAQNTNQTEEGFTGDNLVQQPNKVAKIDIQYAKTAKRVDVQKMKLAMWKIVTKDNKKEPSDNEEEVETVTPILFSDIYKELPKFISGQTLDNLSVPMALVCLLYLVNDKSLSIQSQEDLRNFSVYRSESSA